MKRTGMRPDARNQSRSPAPLLATLPAEDGRPQARN